MADWSTIEAELAAVLTISHRPPHGIIGTTSDGCEVRVERARGIAGEWFVVCAPICRRDELDPELVLERNARLAFATIAATENTYWLRVAVPLDSAEGTPVGRLVSLLVEAARSLAPGHKGLPPTTVFDHYSS